MKRALTALMAVLLLGGCQAEQTACQTDGGDACLSAASASTNR